jgi:hypothetical protein
MGWRRRKWEKDANKRTNLPTLPELRIRKLTSLDELIVQ